MNAQYLLPCGSVIQESFLLRIQPHQSELGSFRKPKHDGRDMGEAAPFSPFDAQLGLFLRGAGEDLHRDQLSNVRAAGSVA